ncbi:AIR synthase family protein [Fusibacter sp. JL298sf-3]
MKVGKLKNDVLEEIVLGEIKKVRTDVLIGPSVGEDCAAVAFGDLACVLTTDPITGSTSNLGRLAVHICVNDIASSGAEPIGIMLTLLFPEETEESQIQGVLREANEAANKLGIEILGGHTEVTSAVTKPVASATAIGRVFHSHLIKTGGAQTGDMIYLTKHPGLEGTSILATDFEAELTGVLSKRALESAKALVNDISVLSEGRIGAQIGVSAMHDATEGGVLGAIYELCDASGKGCRVFNKKFEILPETQMICEHFHIDPLKLISSGVMVFTVAPDKAASLEKALLSAEIPYSRVGLITEDLEKHIVYGEDSVTEIVEVIQMPDADELYRVVG